MQPSDGEIQRRLRAYASPCYGYRRAADGTIEKDLFDGTRPEGWVRSPAMVDAAAALPQADSGDEYMTVSIPQDPDPPMPQKRRRGRPRKQR